MRFESPICRGTRWALLAASVAAMSAAAIAQESTVVPEVRVQASGVIKKQTNAKSLGAPIETAEITVRVSYADLPLDINSGRALLKDRVADAAKDACMRIRYRMGPTVTSDSECIRKAINGATPQVDAAIAAANSTKVRG
jgi:UrcA family protein